MVDIAITRSASARTRISRWQAFIGRSDIRRTFGEWVITSEEKLNLLDSILLHSLRTLLLWSAVLLIVAGTYIGASHPFEQGMLGIPLGWGLGALFFWAYRAVRDNRISARWAHPITAALMATGYSLLLFDLIYGGQREHGTRFVALALMVIMAGAFFLRIRWFLGMTAFIFATWIPVNLAIGMDFSWSDHIAVFVVIVIASINNYAGRKRAITRLIDAQLENERQRTQLTEALERAHRSEAQLKTERDIADQIVDSMGQGLVLLDSDGVIEYANLAAERIIGQAEEALIGQVAGEIFHRRDSDQPGSPDDHGPSDESFEVLINHDDGYFAHVMVSVTAHHGGSIVTLNDLTLRKRFEAKLARLAHHDALTGLANRTLFIDRCEQALARLRRNPGRVAVLFLDLDKFKPINDMMGHSVGDQVLKETANRIRESIRGQDTAARIGGDEFVALLVDIDDADQALEIADRIARRVEEPIYVDGRAQKVAISIGIAINQSPDAKPEDLIHEADTAMYEAKRRLDLNRILYTPAMRSGASTV